MVHILYALAFVVGPALFLLLLLRFDGRSWPLAMIASALVALSFALRKFASPALTVDAGPLLVSVFSIWVAWILVLVLVVRRVRQTYPGPPFGAGFGCNGHDRAVVWICRGRDDGGVICKRLLPLSN